MSDGVERVILLVIGIFVIIYALSTGDIAISGSTLSRARSPFLFWLAVGIAFFAALFGVYLMI